MPGPRRSAPRPSLSAALLAACAGVALGALVPSAGAQVQEPPAAPQAAEAESLTPEALRLIDALDSPEAPERIEASQGLLNPGVASTRALEGVMVSGDLGAEQHRRLLNVILYRFFSEPRAAMGIQWNPLGDQSRSVVLSRTDLGKGFHAEQVLRPNDRIESIDGVEVTSADELPGLIVAHDPGDEVVLDLVRDGKPMTVTLRLGNFADLNDNGRTRGPEQEAMIRGWLRRSAPYAARAGAAVIDAGLTREAWRDEAEGAQAGPHNLRQVLVPMPEVQRLRPMAVEPDELPSIAAGGEARGGREETIFYGLGDARAHPAAVMAIQGDREMRRQTLLMLRSQRKQQLDARRILAERPELKDADRLEMLGEIRDLERELELIEAQIQQFPRRR